MERFRKFADEKTGEHPFLPVKYSQSTGDLVKGVLLLLFRFVLLLLFFILYLFSFGVERFSPRGAWVLHTLQQKFLFWGIGVEINDSGVQPTKKGRRVLTISNLSSFLDLYFLQTQ
jgi:hypothetical protein